MHAALGDETRLRIIDALWLNDRSPKELGYSLGIASNLMAHHLDVLEEAGILCRLLSEGDRRRRYVTVDWRVLDGLIPERSLDFGSVLFVCTHNSARSQFAEAVVAELSSIEAQSAGTTPSAMVHPKAIQVAAERNVDLTGAQPKPFSSIVGRPDVVVAVCDRSYEGSIPFPAQRLHWSIPDPVANGRLDGFRSAFEEIATRVDRLVGSND